MSLDQISSPKTIAFSANFLPTEKILGSTDDLDTISRTLEVFNSYDLFLDQFDRSKLNVFYVILIKFYMSWWQSVQNYSSEDVFDA